jgi:serine O-acetyltransferase
MFARLGMDLRNYGRSSPGRVSRLLVLITSPGAYLTLLLRTACGLYRLGPFGKFLSRVIELQIALLFGCYISSRARIGGGLYFPHPVGIVIGRGVSIGNFVTIYQNVTIGSRGTGQDAYPHVGSNVTVFANVVLAGHVVLPGESIVSAGTVMLSDLGPGAIFAGNPARIVK